MYHNEKRKPRNELLKWNKFSYQNINNNIGYSRW
jgi:hypothetical protein